MNHLPPTLLCACLFLGGCGTSPLLDVALIVLPWTEDIIKAVGNASTPIPDVPQPNFQKDPAK